MGMIFVNRDRQSLGQFTPQDVANGLKSGKFYPEDLAWQEPMAAWLSLSTFTDLPTASLELEPVLAAGDQPPVLMVEPAWERAEPGQAPKAIFETVKQIFASPTHVFSQMPTDAGYMKPMIFFVLVSWVTTAVAILYQSVTMFANPAFATETKGVSLLVIASVIGGVIIISPIFFVAISFINAAVMHLALIALGGANRSFQTTWRVLAYAAGATSVLQLVPIVGGLAASLAQLAYGAIGLKEAHQTELWRPIVAYVLIFLVCCGATVGIVAVVGASAVSFLERLPK